MKILAIDTAADLCAACVHDTATGQFDAVSIDIGKGHVEHLMRVVAEALEASGNGFRDLDRLGVSTGPGSFTGVRTGISAARGFALTLGIPAIGITVLDAIAAEANAENGQNGAVLVAINARREEVYFAQYDDSGDCIDGPAVANVGAVARLVSDQVSLLAGDAAGLIEEAAGVSLKKAVMAATAKIATFARLAAAAPVEAGKPVPLYLRAPDAKPQSGFAVERRG